MSATPVRYFDSTMRGLGGIDGTPGSFTSILDKIAVTGYGQVTAINITVLDGVATANFNANEGFQKYATIRVSGSDIAALNGDHYVKDATTNTCSWPTGAPNGVTTTTVTIKGAPLGFVTVFTDTNKRVIKSGSIDSTGQFIYFDDTPGKYVVIAAYESMNSMTDGINKSPNSVALSFWSKSQQANTTKRNWFIVGDDKCFYYCVSPYTQTLSQKSLLESGYQYAGFFAGDIPEETVLKKYSFLITSSGSTNDISQAGSYSYSGITGHGNDANTNVVMSRDYLGINKSISIKINPLGHYAKGGQMTTCPPLPNPGNAKISIVPLFVMEEYTKCCRGKLPGFYSLAHSTTGNLKTGLIFDDFESLENRAVMAANIDYNVQSDSPSSVYFFDITGPWRLE